MCNRFIRPVNCIIPPYLLRQMMERSKSARQREVLLNSLVAATKLRTQRQMSGLLPSAANMVTGSMRRTIFDAQREYTEFGGLVRAEGGAPSADEAVDSAYDNLGLVYEFYRSVLGRNSIDGRGMRLDAVVHYGELYNNALWNGRAMIFGDGDGELFVNFSKSLDVTAHELAHGVTQFTADLAYESQSGALNESFSDVFGSLVKQWHNQQTADAADWLIGADIFTPGTFGDALRSMKDPGSAYDGDPQPKHMDRYKQMPNSDVGDWGGVHINSGIPNHAFYLVAKAIGGSAWQAPGHIWYTSLMRLWDRAGFQDCANVTYGVASELYGGDVSQIVREAWDAVGIRVVSAAAQVPARRALAPEQSLTELTKRLSKLETELGKLQRHSDGARADVNGNATA